LPRCKGDLRFHAGAIHYQDLTEADAVEAHRHDAGAQHGAVCIGLVQQAGTRPEDAGAPNVLAAPLEMDAWIKRSVGTPDATLGEAIEITVGLDHLLAAEIANDPQFLPKSILSYGTGGSLDVAANALASTANFLKGHGWRAGAGYQPGEANFAAIQAWNAASVYQRAIALIGRQIDGGDGTSARR
jgi:hypothetical protein